MRNILDLRIVAPSKAHLPTRHDAPLASAPTDAVVMRYRRGRWIVRGLDFVDADEAMRFTDRIAELEGRPVWIETP